MEPIKHFNKLSKSQSRKSNEAFFLCVCVGAVVPTPPFNISPFECGEGWGGREREKHFILLLLPLLVLLLICLHFLLSIN